MQRGHRLRRQNGKGIKSAFGALPSFPNSGEGKGSVSVRADVVGLFDIIFGPPFESAIRGHEAAPRFEGIAERRFFADGLQAGVDQRVLRYGVLWTTTGRDPNARTTVCGLIFPAAPPAHPGSARCCIWLAGSAPASATNRNMRPIHPMSHSGYSGRTSSLNPAELYSSLTPTPGAARGDF